MVEREFTLFPRGALFCLFGFYTNNCRDLSGNDGSQKIQASKLILITHYGDLSHLLKYMHASRK